MNLLLNYDQIFKQLQDHMTQKHKNPGGVIDENQCLELLNEMAIQNGYPGFDTTIGNELMDRVRYQHQQLTLSNIAQAFVEANQTLHMKYNLSLEKEELLKESQQLVNQVHVGMTGNQVFIREIAFQGKAFRPALQISIGQEFHHCELQGHNGWFRIILNHEIRLDNLIDDLRIDIVEGEHIITMLLLAMETLPSDEVREAEFPSEGNIIYIACQLQINNQYLIQDKHKYLQEQLLMFNEDIMNYEDQLIELGKPFLLQRNTEQHRISHHVSAEVRKSFQLPISHENLSHQPNQVQQPFFRPSENAAAFKNKEQALPHVFISRTDAFFTIAAIISCLINFSQPEFLTLSLWLFYIMLTMLKKTQLLNYFAALILLNLLIDVIHLIRVPSSVIVILLRGLNVLIKMGGLGSLIYNIRHPPYLKKQKELFLQIM